jgi:hypothetical protein
MLNLLYQTDMIGRFSKLSWSGTNTKKNRGAAYTAQFICFYLHGKNDELMNALWYPTLHRHMLIVPTLHTHMLMIGRFSKLSWMGLHTYLTV